MRAPLLGLAGQTVEGIDLVIFQNLSGNCLPFSFCYSLFWRSCFAAIEMCLKYDFSHHKMISHLLSRVTSLKFGSDSQTLLATTQFGAVLLWTFGRD